MTFLEETPVGDDGLCVLRCDLWGYNAIGVVSGDEAIAVDPGITPDELARFRRVLEGRALEGRGLEGPALEGGAQGSASRRVTAVVLTHSHHDHIRGWNAFPGATVVAPQVVADKAEGPRERILAGKNKVDSRLGVDDPEFRYPDVDVTFERTHELRVGDLDVLLEMLPGHSNCTSVAIIPALKTILTADYLVVPGLPYCRWEPAPFEASHHRLHELVAEHAIERAIPAHNDLIEGAGAIRAAIDAELSYFADLRALIDREVAAGTSDDLIVRRAGRHMGERRGVDLGPRARQDHDNARRVLAEIR